MKKQSLLLVLVFWKLFPVLHANVPEVLPFPLVDVNQQSKRITGVVYNDLGEPVIGANVVEKGTTNGTITDLEGNFSLGVSENATLVISYIGFLAQEVDIKGQTVISVTLTEDTQALDEVIVIGYGTTQRKNFTGSVSQVKMEDSPLSLVPTSNALDALRGTVTGMTVSQQQGAGQSPSLLVRGQKSISGGTDPLIVLDGVIFMGGIRDIDPNIIESMSVLKDATSVASYGSRAANGVIMINTKKGKFGKPVINLNASWAFSSMANKPDLLSPEDYIRKVNAIQGYDENADPTVWMSDFEKENYLKGHTTDWLDLVSRTGLMQNYSLSISGATEKTNYFISASHTDQEGVLKGDDYNRQAFSARVKTDITSWLEVGADMNYSFNDYSGPTNYDIYQAVRLTPYGRVYRDEENKLLEKYPRTEGTYMVNPLWNVESGTIDDHDTYSTYLMKGHLLVKCPWIEGLSYRLNISYSNEYIERDYFTHEGYYVPQGVSNDRYSSETLSTYLSSANGYSNRTKNTSWVWDNIVNYTRQFGKHLIDLTYVYTRDSYVYNFRGFSGQNFSTLGNTELGYNGLVYAEIQKVENIDYTKKNNIGYLGRVNYNYDDKYHLTASIRRDGSSVFGVDNKWGVFPSVGVAWTISREAFLESIREINYLKIKASWGKNGNQSISPYGTLSRISLGQAGGYSYPFGNTSEVSWGQRNSTLGNTELGWETTTAFNAGFELAMFNNRLNIDFDGYVSKTTDQIFSRTIPVMTNSVTSMSATMGQVNNWGIEVNTHSTNIRTKDFEWNSMLTYYINRNTLKELYGDGEDDISNSLFIGKSLGAMYGYKPVGIVQVEDTEYMEANNAQPGDVMFADLDGDGVITADDRTILGYTKENFRMSLGNTLRYKDFELYFLFTGIFGGKGYNRDTNIYAYRTMSDVTWDNNFNHGWWTEENRSNKYPSVNYTDSRYSPKQNKSFVRLQDVTLSYTFRQPWVKQLYINNLKVYMAAKNLITFTGWTGGDPEIAQTLGSGYSYGYPLAKSFSLGINLTF